MDGVVAQLAERLVRNEKVRGSTPLGSTTSENGSQMAFLSPLAFGVASAGTGISLFSSISNWRMNAELCRKALEKVGNPNVLTNIVSRRVRQLTSGSGALSRPLITNADNLGAADVALLEIIEEKIGWELPEPVELVREKPKRKSRKH